MRVIGSGDDDRVQAFLVHELAEIGINLRSGKTFASFSRPAFIDIAQSDDGRAGLGDLVGIVFPLAGDPNDPHMHTLVGRDLLV